MMITIKDLFFKYPGNDRDTIKGLNFEIGQGEIFGFLGPSGAGKTTTQKIIIGILKKYRGSVKVLDREISDRTSGFYEDIGVAFEFPNFYSKFSALENLNFFRAMYKNKTRDPLELLELVGLKDHAKTRVVNFSKGMKMRLNFCRALLNEPHIIFLDEPTSGLDPVNAMNIKNLIREKKAAGTTIFLTTHNMTVADDLCDRVAFIVDGKISLIDSPRELKIKAGKKMVRVEYRKDERLLHNDFALEGLDGNKAFQNIMKHEAIETIHTQEATLEDIFIKTTGRSLS